MREEHLLRMFNLTELTHINTSLLFLTLLPTHFFLPLSSQPFSIFLSCSSFSSFFKKNFSSISFLTFSFPSFFSSFFSLLSYTYIFFLFPFLPHTPSIVMQFFFFLFSSLDRSFFYLSDRIYPFCLNFKSRRAFASSLLSFLVQLHQPSPSFFPPPLSS